MSTELTIEEKQVYNSYRAALKSRKVLDIHRAGARKQTALKNIADRRNVPVSEVKEIIRKGDLVNGITHEHNPGYLEEYAIKTAFEKAVADFTANPVPCTCGNTDDVRVYVRPLDGCAEDRTVSFVVRCFDCYSNLENEVCC